MTVKVRFDGRVFVPDSPVALPVGHTLDLEVPSGTDSLEQRFHQLADSWSRQTAHHSSSSARFAHPDYRAIIELGWPVVPLLLLADLAVKQRHWFVALKSITETDPVPAGDIGHIGRMIEAWQRWALERGV